MSDSNITRLSSLALAKVDRTKPYITNAPSDGTLALGNMQTTDIPSITNNENYNPAILPVATKDNFKIKDGTVVFNRDLNALQYFYNGKPLSLAGVSGGTAPKPIVFQENPNVSTDNDHILKYSSLQPDDGSYINITPAGVKDGTILKQNSPVFNQSKTELLDPENTISIHDNRRASLKALGASPTTNSTALSDLGYLQFSNDANSNSEGFVYLDGSPTMVLQHQTAGTGAAAYTNSCVTFTGGSLSASSTSANAVLEVNSITGGFLPSRLTTTQINALSLSSSDKGLVVYNATTNRINICNGTTFDPIPLITSGTGTLNGTTGTVINTAAVSTTSQIFVTPQIPGTTINPITVGTVRVGKIVAGSFTVFSTVAADTSSFSWMLVN